MSYSFDVDLVLGLLLQKYTALCLSHLCLNTLGLAFLFSVSSAFKGWFSLQVLKVVMTSELSYMRYCCTLLSWLTLLRSGMLRITSVSTPCPVLILFFHREECAGRGNVSKRKKNHLVLCSCVLSCSHINVMLRTALSASVFPSCL